MKIISRNINKNALKKLKNEDINPILAQIYASRGIDDPKLLKSNLSFLLRPDLLRDCQKSGSLLAKAIANNEKIIVIADYDADGATACALIIDFLRTVGANTGYLVPDRRKDGYGLTPELVELAALKKPDWLITVDNGIASVKGVERANELQIKTVITDHHLPGADLPKAEAIVNPNQPKCNFPSKNLCGVGVIFYVASAIRKSLRDLDWFKKRPEPNMREYLDLVALGTIADVVPLDFNNRILVENGLSQIRMGKNRPGISALIEISGKKNQNLTSQDLAFSIAPRLNAAGRMENMASGIDCLLTQNYENARRLAVNLNNLNTARRQKEKEMKDSATTIVEQTIKQNYIGHTYFNDSWHEGLVGILASRIKEKINRPVFVFAPSINKSELKGSGRSIQGFHLRDALDLIAKNNPTLLLKFGGHAMAAGLTIERNNLTLFKDVFNEVASQLISKDQLENVVLTDGSLGKKMNLREIDEIHKKIWGQGFEKPLFVDNFIVLDQYQIAKIHKKLIIRKDNDSQEFEAVCFRETNFFPKKIKAVYELSINNYQNKKSIQLIIAHWYPCETSRKNDKILQNS